MSIEKDIHSNQHTHSTTGHNINKLTVCCVLTRDDQDEDGLEQAVRPEWTERAEHSADGGQCAQHS